MAAEYDPTQQHTTWGEGGGYGVEEDNQESSSQNSDQQQEADLPTVQAPPSPGDLPSNDGATDDVGDYDPESVTPLIALTPEVAEPKAPLKPSPQPSAKKPKSAGGFLVGDSDSEDDAHSTQASNSLVSGPNMQSHPFNRSPLHQSTSDHEAGSDPSNAPPASQVKAVVTSVADGTSSAATGVALSPHAAIKARLPNDTIGILEDRIRDDPRGAMDAWLALMAEHRKRNKTEDARRDYERFLAIFPQAADIWVQWIEMELGMSNFSEAENIFRNCLMQVPSVQLFTVYLDYVRRRNDLSDSSGVARQTVTRAYDFVLANVGFDKDAGKIWADYILFIRHSPGTVGGSSWQDQQKMDLLRKAYQKAVCMPISNVNILWKEYDQFEMGLNKQTGRKFLADRSPGYMSAKSANTALENITRGLQRSTLPRLPPAPGFEGDQEYLEQVELWKKWIAWEKSDPLDLERDDPELLRKRILYTYKQALAALRFWPEMWVDAAEWCFEKNITEGGTEVGLDLLLQGIAANPESVLLALKHADRVEITHPVEENDDARAARGAAVREPYNKVLDTLYDLIKNLKEREKQDIARVKEAAAQDAHTRASETAVYYDDDDDERISNKSGKDAAQQQQIKAIQQGYAAQTQLLSRTISFVWIALARAMRRVQGKGKPGTALGGMRQVFTEARQRGRLTSDVYVAVAQLEWTVYKDPAGAKIFERGSKLFPEDEHFTIEYLKFLHSRDDNTNARVVFETCVNKLTQKPEMVQKAKPLYAYFHKYESQFGDLSHIVNYEKRMAELFPEDPKLSNFNARYSTDKFDPITARIIVSPAMQLRPKLLQVIQSIEQPTSMQNSPHPQHRQPNSPRPQFLGPTNSPKRPFPLDDFEDLNPPRKIQRGESPLKGAAGRRLDQQRRAHGHGGAASHSAAPAPIARDITFLLSQIPPADTYNSHKFNANSMVRLLRDTAVPDYSAWSRHQEQNGRGHNRNLSTEYGSTSHARDSPAPVGRPPSPYDSSGTRSRLAPASSTYRQSPLRPGSRDSYEPPPAVYRQDLPPPTNPYGHPPPPGVPVDGAAPPTAWPLYAGGPPPVQAPPGYPPPPMNPYQQGLPGQPPYGAYRY